MTTADRLLRQCLWIGASIAVAGALLHVAAIAGGASWYAFFGAPPAVVASARAGTWLAPASAAIIAALMALCAVYACSALGVVRRLPLLRTTLAAIAAICLLRGVILLPLAWLHPELRNTFEIVAAVVWAAAGVGFAAGFLYRGSAGQISVNGC